MQGWKGRGEKGAAVLNRFVPKWPFWDKRKETTPRRKQIEKCSNNKPKNPERER